MRQGEERLKKYEERIEKQQQKFKEMKKEQLLKYEQIINELLEMNAIEWEEYLERTIKGLEGTLKSGIDHFEKRRSLKKPQIYLFGTIEDKLEDRRNILDKLKNNNDFVSELRERVKKDLDGFNPRLQRIDSEACEVFKEKC